MTATVITTPLAHVLENQVPMVDMNADGIVESMQVAHVETVSENTAAMLVALLDPNPVAVTPIYSAWLPKAAAANATTTIGASGGIGDILGGIQVTPLATTSHDVSIKDGSKTAVLVYKGKTTAEIKDIPPISFGPNGLPSDSGAWQVVSAGTGSSATVWGKFGDTALPALIDTYITTEGLSATTNTNTFTTVSIGSADVRRRVVIAVTSSGGSVTHTALTATLYDNAGAPAGTITFTKVAGSEISTAAGVAGTPDISFWEALVQTGTQIGSPILTTAGTAPTRVGLSYYTHGRGAALGTTPILQTSAGATTLSGTINVASGGLIIGHCVTNTGAQIGLHTWTGLNDTYDSIQLVSTTTVAGGMYTGALEVGRSVVSTWPNSSVGYRLSVIAFGAVV